MYLKFLSRTSKSTRTKALVSLYQLLIKTFSFYFCIYRSLFLRHILNPYNLKSIQIVCVFFYLTFIDAFCYLISITYSSFVVDCIYYFILSSAIFSRLQPSSAIFSHLQPSSAIFSHLQPSSAVFSRLQPSSAIFSCLQLSSASSFLSPI
jgi:hypothetical protein